MIDISDSCKDAQLNQIKLPNHLALLGTGMIRNNSLLSQTLRADVKRWYLWSSVTKQDEPQAFIGWGYKKSFKRANKFGSKLNIPVYSVEDSFLRSIDSGINSRHSASMIVDDLGIYFDLTKTSRLEQMILFRGYHEWTDSHQEKAKHLINKICDNNLSKYNYTTHCPDLNTLSSSKKPAYHVLLVDQVAGDASIVGAGADKSQFIKMFKDAFKQHPKAHIWIKTHPASTKGYLSTLSLSKAQKKRVHFVSQVVNPIKLLKQVESVYTVSSHMGFEALMLGKQVYCYGMSWYAGWGLTIDSGIPKKLLKTVKKRRDILKRDRQLKISLTTEQLFFAAYLDYSHYVDPATSKPCDVNEVINWLVTNRNLQQQLLGELTIYKFSRWKIPFVKQFLQTVDVVLTIKHKSKFNVLPKRRLDITKPILVWGLAKKTQMQIQSPSLSIYCMEDGFIRSNGLGATLLAPLSVVIDKQGIYYDATKPSDLESYLQKCPELTAEQQCRVDRLHANLLTNKVSKYNVGNNLQTSSSTWVKRIKSNSAQKILVVGQVEDDLSIQNCASSIRKNAELIKRVRKDNPTAFLVYKPHPDVEAGLRVGKVDKKTLKLVDAVANDMAMPDCLELIDVIHTISSLTGFEALLRNKKVVCYGLPFYAGWGLTTDADSHLEIQKPHLKRRRRKQQLSLQQLIFCTLIQYPLYRLPNGFGLAQVEQVIDYLYHDEARQIESKHFDFVTITKSMKSVAKLKFMQVRNLTNQNKK